ncbi:unnamed protein product [Effrenium voratum]|uniref:Cyclic nucleotide-binding domain-containing protein n=1 Tax=Effrenium voratum TaxID=2562239 RepID=A0AA36NLM3_9DINO|nr:unnamed protein product [Effrenium voratum]
MLVRLPSEIRNGSLLSPANPCPPSPTASFQPSSNADSPWQSPAGAFVAAVVGARRSFVMPSPSGAANLSAAVLKAKEHLEVLMGCPFFKKLNLDSRVQRRLSSIATCLKISKGTVLFRQGDPPGNCYVILEGSVGIVKPDEETKTGYDSREGTPRLGETLRLDRTEALGQTDVVSDSLSECERESTMSLTRIPGASPSRLSARAAAAPAANSRGQHPRPAEGRRYEGLPPTVAGSPWRRQQPPQLAPQRAAAPDGGPPER